MTRIARTAEECDRLFAEFVRAADLDGLVSLYEPAACMVHRDGTVATGHDQLRNGLSRLTSEPTEIRVRIVKVIACDAVTVIYNDWVATRTLTDGSVTEWSGKAIEIVRRQQDGRWLFAIDDPFARSRADGGGA
jgi:uncharacterized protein (TIGR02246 family)